MRNRQSSGTCSAARMTVSGAEHGAASAGGSLPVMAMRNYALGILVAVYTFNFIDRQILSILAEPIRTELQLSDTALGLLSGVAFAIFYATLGIPIAKLADRRNRRNLIALALAVWSGMTALSGLAQNFWHLLFARIGVGIGEAGCTPPAHSMIADYFPVDKRATAMGIYSLGIPLGILAGFLVGGLINEYFGWRAAFLVVGLPGILLAVIVRLTIPEPPRGLLEHRIDPGQAPSIKETAKNLWRKRTFRHLSAGAALASFLGSGLLFWLPSFLIRSFSMTTSEVGILLGLILGLPGALGIVLGGWLSDRLGSKDTRWHLWVAAVGIFASLPFYLGVFLAGSGAASLLFLVPAVILGNFFQAATFSQVQGLATLRSRSVSAAILFFITNVFGLGLGPQCVGIVSDLLKFRLGADSLRYSLLLLSFVSIWASFHYYKAGLYLKRDLGDAGSESQ